MASNELMSEGPREPSQLFQMMSQLADQLASIRSEQAHERAQFAQQLAEIRAEHANEREASRKQIRVLQENLASLPHTRPIPPISTTAPSQGLGTPTIRSPLPPLATIMTGPTKKKPTLPDPPRFDGTRKKFRT
jgi:septal ring factor EnvC (AmiA/AmiB activator)